MPPRKYVIDEKELNHLEGMEGVAGAIRELTALLTNRTQDLPHRFKCPKAFAEYMEDWGTNSTYYSIPIHGSGHIAPMQIQMTTRPTQKILELVFVAADGMRLFTLELEYGAV